MDCLDETTVTLFLDRRLRADRAADVEAHIDGCGDCRQLLSALARGRVPEGAPPDRIDRYILKRVIGQGGMGTVYAAYDPLLDRDVALKLVHRALMREAQAMARISSPHVVAVFDVGVVDDQAFIAMELVTGTTLGAWLRGARRGWREVVRVMEAAGRGLAAAHAAGLVHRDFKPDNVLIDGDRVRVADFGLATPIARDGEPEHAVVGTPAYMAPEQLANDAADAKSDQFSFCVALYEALQGVRPFAGDTVTALAEAVRAGRVRPWTGAVPGWLRAAVTRGLAVERADRHPSMDALVGELARRRTRGRTLAIAAGGVALVAVAVAGWQLARPASGPTCSGFERQLDGIWDDARRRDLGGRLASAGVAYAKDSTGEIERVLDAYAHAWIAMRTEACQAHARGEQSDRLLDARMRCLDRRRDRLDALVRELAPATIAKAVQAVHALEPIAECASPAVEAAPDDAPERAQLVAWERALANAMNLWQLGRYADSERVAAGVVAVAPSKAVAAEAQLVQAMAVEKRGDLVRADQLYRDAALAAEASKRDRIAARARIGRIKVAIDTGRFDDAREGLLAAAAATERAGSQRDLRRDLATQRGILAATEGKFEDARAQFQTALDLSDADELTRAKAASNLANSQMQLGHYREAQRIHEQALAARRKVLGDSHPDVATSRLNLGETLLDQGLYDQGGEHIAAALAIFEAAFGPEHPRVAVAAMELANARDGAGKHAEALALQRRALAIQERIGKERPEVALIHNNIADAFDAMGKYEDALAEYRVALALRERVLGPDHPDVGASLNNMANTLLKVARYREALAAFERALAIKTRALGPDHVRLAPSLVGIGAARIALGDAAHAIAPLERGCAMLAKESAPEDLAECRSLLARARGSR